MNTSIETILFGTSDIGIETKRAVNITILLIKRYLYVCRCKKIIPSVEGSLEFLNYNKSIELSSSHLLPKTKKQSINKIMEPHKGLPAVSYISNIIYYIYTH